MWLVLLVACSGGEQTEGVVWNGWTYRWDLLEHRISLLTVMADDDGGATLGLVGGDWSTGATFRDNPEYRVRNSRVYSDAWTVVQGETEFTVGPDGVLQGGDVVDDPTLLGFSQQAVLLRGFSIDTDVEQVADYPDYDPALGYTSRGFAFSVGNASVGDDGLSFDIDGEVRWAAQDRDDMNAAIPYATTGVTVAWTAIGFEGATDSADWSASTTYPHTPPYSAQPAFGLQDLPLTLSSDTPSGVIGLSAFDLLVDATDGSGEGDYLRSFGTELISTGNASNRFEGYARAEITDSSLIEPIQITSTVSGTATWVGLDDRHAVVDPIVMAGAQEVGTVDLAAPSGW